MRNPGERQPEPPKPLHQGPRALDIAACQMYETDNPYLEFENLQSYHALEICGHCALRLACLKFELVHDTTGAVRGGLTSRDRDMIRPAYLAKLAEEAAKFAEES